MCRHPFPAGIGKRLNACFMVYLMQPQKGGFNKMKALWIAPCGMNCRLCYAFIRPKNACLGCNAPDDSKPKACTNCKIVQCEKRVRNGWATCAPCDKPCRRLKDLDKRYKAQYHMSMTENLACIRNRGIDAFLGQQVSRFKCPTCGEVLCVHREDCPNCNAPAWD